MSYFLSTQNIHLGDELELGGEESRHILLSRRMKVGDGVIIQGADGKRFKTEIKKATKNSLTVAVRGEVSTPAELRARITLFQSVVSEKALDFVFQKSTELGAAGITLFNSQNTAVRLSGQQFKAKLPRWQKILWEAAKQCDRGQVPELKFLLNTKELCVATNDFQQTFILDAGGIALKPNINKLISPFCCIVGPEGGFASAELAELQTIKKSTTITLSPFTLRAETAAIAGLIKIQSQAI